MTSSVAAAMNAIQVDGSIGISRPPYAARRTISGALLPNKYTLEVESSRTCLLGDSLLARARSAFASNGQPSSHLRRLRPDARSSRSTLDDRLRRQGELPQSP